ncbi:hypothetical protein K1M91_15625 [Motilimonas sp. E26]|nr:hypothetical protein [Motilimonas sp. E26]
MTLSRKQLICPESTPFTMSPAAACVALFYAALTTTPKKLRTSQALAVG